MKKTILRLAINDSCYLTLAFFGKVKDIYLFDEVTIAYHQNRKKYILYTKNFWIAFLDTFAYLMPRVLNNQWQLHPSINFDIGFLWSEYSENRNKYNFVEAPLENSTYWVGLDNLFLVSQQYGTWLYNKNNDIYLEITPCYKWHHIKPKKNENYITYNQFIKNYQPIAVIQLDRKIAQKWLKTINRLDKIARKNYEKAVQQEEVMARLNSSSTIH